MRGPFSLTLLVSRLLTVLSMFRLRQKLSESGWFNEGLGSLSSESDVRKGQLVRGIHKETPMFSVLFQEIQDKTHQYLRDS